MADDYSKETLRKRKLLWKSALQEKEEGKNVRLERDKLLVDNDLYCWDFAKDTRMKIRSIKKNVPAPNED